MKSLLVPAVGLLFLGTSLLAHADTTYLFSATGSGFESSGTITVAPSGTAGIYDITGITGEVDGTTITGLIPGSYDAAHPTLIGNGDFSFDNLFYSPAPYFDFNGVGINVGTSGYQFNFFYDSSGAYETWDSNNINLVLDSFTISSAAAATPEPSSFLLLGTGVLGALGAVRRRLRS